MFVVKDDPKNDFERTFQTIFVCFLVFFGDEIANLCELYYTIV